MPRSIPLLDRIESMLLWLAAFAYACGFFFSVTLLFKYLPPTTPVAIGYVTITGTSKLRDYVGIGLFLVLVPLLTIYFRILGERLLERQQAGFRWLDGRRREGLQHATALLFTTPFLLSPIFHLFTGKVGWILILPAVLAFAGPALLRAWTGKRAIRTFFSDANAPYHALVFSAGTSWLLFRYLVTGRRLAHYPTLFLELVFLALFLALFWAGAFLLATLAERMFGADRDAVFRRASFAGLVFLALPVVALAVVPLTEPRLLTVVVFVVAALATVVIRRAPGGAAAWKIAAFVAVPVLVYVISYGSTSHPSAAVDLFHRGESIGPASDYLRGKVPYRDVFVLHGMLEDGLLDYWLMELFGRSLDVAIWRTVILGSFLGVTLWFLGIALFRSIPLAALVVVIGAWTTAENNRTFFQVLAVALFWMGLGSAKRRWPLFASGAVAAFALFFSYEIGVYTITGALGSCVAVAIASRRCTWDGARPAIAAALFVAGTLAGALPFVIYLASRGGLQEFANQSFVVIPRIIDAVWSLPFPDLVEPFRKNFTLDTAAEFFLREKFHLVLSPLVIAISMVYVLSRWWRRSLDRSDVALLVLALFAAVAQRTAFGRAEFRHQYFAAFLIGPLIVMLGVLLYQRARTMWRDGDTGTRAFIATLVVAAVPLFSLTFWVPALINQRLDDFRVYVPRVSGDLRESHAEQVRFRVEALREEIAKLAGPNDPIFDFSNQPALYFFANRPNPTRYYQVPILSPAAMQAETIGVLEATKPKVILRKSPDGYDSFDGVPNELRAQALAAYIDDNYRFLKSVRGVEIWRRARFPRPAPVNEYLSAIRMPSKKELRTGTARMVFPAVGSLTGVGGSYWVSELTLHNAFRDPLVVSLRYVAGELRIDRRVKLAPRETRRWPDVVKTLFGTSESIGVLWVEHATARSPVAVVKTWDKARESQVAIETPLTPEMAVTGGAEVAELTIVGLPEARIGRRINVGIVNVGKIPATFRITARTPSGAVIGKPVESGIPEDEIWLVPDVETVLGVRIDESTTIRLTAVAGSGVGFATIVDPSGGNEFIAAIPTEQQ